jgi:hypothetical protein
LALAKQEKMLENEQVLDWLIRRRPNLLVDNWTGVILLFGFVLFLFFIVSTDCVLGWFKAWMKPDRRLSAINLSTCAHTLHLCTCTKI